MKRTITEWLFWILALIVVGPIVGWLVGSVRGPEGWQEGTALVSASPVLGLVLNALAILLAGAVGLAAARLLGSGWGLFAMGLTLTWGAWQTARLDEVVRAVDHGNVLTRLALEGAILAGVALGVAAIVDRTGERAAIARDDRAVKHAVEVRSRRSMAIATAAALPAAAFAAWALARSEAVGQTFAAAVAAGMLGALAARMASFHSPRWTGLLGVLLLAIIGPLATMFLLEDPLPLAVNRATVFALGRVMPMDWIAGALVGVPIGWHWGASITEREERVEPAVA